jgi:hypothetical protein
LKSSPDRHGIEVRDQSVSHLKELGHDILVLEATKPGFSNDRLVPVAVQPEDGREGTELSPSDHEIVVGDTVVMTSDIVQLPAKPDVG